MADLLQQLLASASPIGGGGGGVSVPNPYNSSYANTEKMKNAADKAANDKKNPGILEQVAQGLVKQMASGKIPGMDSMPGMGGGGAGGAAGGAGALEGAGMGDLGGGAAAGEAGGGALAIEELLPLLALA